MPFTEIGIEYKTKNPLASANGFFSFKGYNFENKKLHFAIHF